MSAVLRSFSVLMIQRNNFVFVLTSMKRIPSRFLITTGKDVYKRQVMQCPKIEKVVINMGVGDAIANPKALDEAVAELTPLAGQKPVLTKAKQSIANFKLREGMPIGCKVTQMCIRDSITVVVEER